MLYIVEELSDCSISALVDEQLFVRSPPPTSEKAVPTDRINGIFLTSPEIKVWNTALR